MAYYDLISENEKSTVVAEFEKGIFAAEAPYMSERNLEDQFVEQLRWENGVGSADPEIQNRPQFFCRFSDRSG